MTNEQKLKKLNRLGNLKQTFDDRKTVVLFDEFEQLDKKDAELEQQISEVAQELNNTNEVVSEISSKIDEVSKVEGPAGKDADESKIVEEVLGKIPVPDESKIVSEVLGKIPKPKDGYTPKKGKDYYTPPERDEIVREAVALIPTPKDGEKGADGSPDTGEQIVEKLNILENVLEPKVLVGWENLQKNLTELNTRPIKTGWGAHPLTIQESGTTKTKNARFLNFTGATVTESPSGVTTIAVTGGVTSVSNSDGTLTISPTTGAAVASVNLAHDFIWTANHRWGEDKRITFGYTGTYIRSNSPDEILSLHSDSSIALRTGTTDNLTVDNSTVTSARDVLVSGTKTLFFNQKNSGSAYEGRIRYSSGMDIGLFNHTGAKLGNGPNLTLHAVDGSSVTNANGGSVFLYAGAGVGSGTNGYVGIGNAVTPLFLVAGSGVNDLIVGGQLEVQSNFYLPTLSDGLLRTTSGLVGLATAGTDYVTSVSVTSPITNTGTAAAPNIGFDFSTNNIWAGTNKINTNSTTAFFVEQDGVKDNVFVIDTTNAAVSINQAIDTTAALGITVSETTLNPARLFGLKLTQTYSDRANASAISATITQNKTTGNGSNFNGMLFNIFDNTVTTSGSGNQVQGINVSATRSTTFSTTRTSDNLRMFYLQGNDSGNYNAVTSGSANSYGVLVQSVLSPTTNPASGTPTLTYNGFGLDVQITGTPVQTAGTLVYNVYGARVNLTGGTAGTTTGYAFYVQGVSGYDTNYAYYNSTAVSNLLAIDNGKTYEGTGLDVFTQYTGSIWDFDIALATTSIDFNRSLFDTDFNVWGDTDTMLHLDAGGSTSYFEHQVSNSSTSFQFRQLDGTAYATFDSSTPKVLLTRLNLASVAGTTVEGDVWADSTQKALQTYVNTVEHTVSTTLFTQTADKTVANTVTETSIIGTGVGTVTLPANFLVAGKSLKLRVYGYHSSTGNPNITVKIKLGSTVVASGTGTSGNGSTNGFFMEAEVTCRTAGATGTVSACGEYNEIHSGGLQLDLVQTGTTTIDTTASQTLDITVTWGTAAAGNTITSQISNVEILN